MSVKITKEKENIENFKIIEEGIACVDDVMVGMLLELENELITLEERESKEVSLTKIHIEKYYDRDEHDALIS